MILLITADRGLFAVGFPIYNSANQLVAGLSVGGVDDSERPDVVEKYIQQGRNWLLRSIIKWAQTITVEYLIDLLQMQI